MKIFYPCCRRLLSLFFTALYRHKTFGTAHIPAGRAIIAPNHVSFFDPPMISVSCPEEVHFLARESLFEHPLFGALIRSLNAFPVSGDGTDLVSIKSVLHLLKEDKKVTIFPEGVRTSDGKIGAIRPGIARIAMMADAPIVPAYIRGSYEVWPRQQKFPKLRGITSISFGPPIHPSSFTCVSKKERPQAIASQVKNSIARLQCEIDG